MLCRIIILTVGLAIAGSVMAQVPGGVAPGAAQPLPPAAPPAVPSVSPQEFPVPPVVDRPLGKEEGPRVHVTRFVLAGAKDHEKKGLTLASLQKVLDQAVASQPAAGYTVNQMQDVAVSVQTLYRNAGYVLAAVFVPAQDVKNGEVKIQVLEGTLGAVRVEGNKHYNARAVAAPFTPVQGSTVNQTDVEARLLRLSDYPGISVFGVFTPGANVGESDLTLKVQHEKLVDVMVGFDNYGNPSDGEYRGDIGLTFNSPFGIGDKFDISFLKARSSSSTASGADTRYFAGDYRVPFAAGRAALDAAYSDTDYTVGNLQGLVTGRAKIGDLEFDYETTRSRLGHSFFFIKAESKHADFSQQFSSEAEHLKDGVIGFTIDRTDSSVAGRWLGTVSVLHGSNSDSGAATIRQTSDSSYTVGRIDIERLQRVTRFNTLRLKLSGQFTSDSLPSLEEESLGGPATVRAYDVANYVGDKSYGGNLEWYIGAPGFASKPGPGSRPWGDTFQFVLFADYAHGSLNKPAASDVPDSTLKGWGAGLVFNVPHHVFFRADYSKPISATTLQQESRFYKDGRWYASLGVMF